MKFEPVNKLDKRNKTVSKKFIITTCQQTVTSVIFKSYIFIKVWAKREKQNKNLKYLIRFFVYRHLFPSRFSTNETTGKLANVFVIFLFRHQFFLCYKIADLNTWRNELNLQKEIKNIHKI